MKNYNNDKYASNRFHTVRVTLQSGEYKGHIAERVGGNCLGKYLLEWNPDCDSQEDVEKYVENDCNFEIDDENEIYCYTLADDQGNKCSFESDIEELEHNVVAIEIVDCVIDEEG